MLYQTRRFCRSINRRVIIYTHVFRSLSGIGDDYEGVQIERACSVEDGCSLRETTQCPLRGNAWKSSIEIGRQILSKNTIHARLSNGQRG